MLTCKGRLHGETVEKAKFLANDHTRTGRLLLLHFEAAIIKGEGRSVHMKHTRKHHFQITRIS